VETPKRKQKEKEKPNPFNNDNNSFGNLDNSNNIDTWDDNYYNDTYTFDNDDNNMTTNQHIMNYLQRNIGGTTIRVEPFYGDGIQDPLKWLEDFDKAARINDWDNTRKIALLKAHMRDDAEEWCETAEATTWAEWANAFKEFFCTFRWINKWHRELDELRQGNDETIDTYYAIYRRLIRKIDKITEIPANDKMRYFVKGLRPDLAPVIMMHDPANPAAAIELIRKYEAGEDVVKRREPRRSRNQTEPESESEEEKPRRKETKKKKSTEKGDLDDLVQKFEKLQINLAQKLDLLTKQVNRKDNNNNNYNNNYNNNN